MRPNRFPLLLLATAALACGWPGVRACAQGPGQQPKAIEGIGVDQNFGAALPLHLEFDDEHNQHVRLGDYFHQDKPVILSFNYSNCPQLCSIQLQNLAVGLQMIDLKPGRDFEIVSVSIDPLEQTSRARQTEEKFVAVYGDLQSAGGWHFLTGDLPAIELLTDVCGFRYKYIPDQRIYSHPAAFIFCSPDGKIVRYLDGLNGQLGREIPKALVEASAGRIGSWTDRVLYFANCFVYDEEHGRYSLAVMNIVRIVGAITAIGLVAWLAPYWLRRRQPAPPVEDAAGHQPIASP